MRLSTLFIFITSLQLSAIGYSQNARISLKINNGTLADVFKEIERQSEYKIFYKVNQIDLKSKVNYNAEDRSVKDVLKGVLPDKGATFDVVDKVIVITPAVKQSIKVTGIVSDSKGEPIPGVSVTIKGTSKGAVTDGEGRYSLEVPSSEAVLQYSFIGFTNQERTVGNQSSINITLQEDIKKLDEVVVIGYGTVKKGNIAGSVSKINSNVLEDRPISRVEQALYGEMSGVQVRTTTGEPGQALQVRVRGTASISASKDPLYIVDGVPVSSLSDINANDIQSMEVLKDAASAAIYGSRGSNGVVLITTKGGKKGTNFQFSYRVGVQKMEKKIPLLGAEDWIDMQKQILDTTYIKWGKTNNKTVSVSDNSYQRTAIMGQVSPKNYPTAIYDPRWAYGQDSLTYVDWQNEFYRTAPISEYNLSASGGTDNLSYRISGGYLDQDGIAVYTNFKRVNLRANVDVKKGRLSYGINLAPSISWYDGGYINGKDALSHKILTMAPVVEKNAGLNTGADGNAVYSWATSSISPVAFLREQTYETQTSKLLSTTYLNEEIFKGLNLRVQAALNVDNVGTKVYRPTSIMYAGTQTAGANSYASQATSNNIFYSLETTLNYDKTFGKHYINAVIGHTAETTKNSSTTQSESSGFANDALTDFDYTTVSGATTVSKTNSYKTTLESYLGRVIYTYNNRYQVQASIRTDGSSRFGGNKRWGAFPSVGAFWRISEESFFEPVTKWVNDLKIRYSWGMAGNNSLNSPTLTTTGNIYPSIGTLGSYTYSFNGSTVAGYSPTATSNPNLSWEKTSSSDIGIDFGIFKNRITVSADYYQKFTTDLLLQVPVPLVTGFEKEWQNIGHVKNTGLELELTSHNTTGAFKWNTTLTLGHNENKVTKLGPSDAPIYTSFDNGSSNVTQVIKVGEALDAFYLYDAIGVYMNQTDLDNSPHMSTNKPGDVKYRDVNGDGIIDSNDRTVLGHKTPDFSWGFSNSFSYKNFDLSILLNGQSGGKIYSILGRAFDRPGMGSKTNALAHWKNRWISADRPGDGKTPNILSTSTSSLFDSRWLYDASYWKIKSLALGYTFPASTLKGILNGARIYFSAENLFMHDHYEGGYSPESDNNQYGAGDYGAYPGSKTYIIGVNINF